MRISDCVEHLSPFRTHRTGLKGFKTIEYENNIHNSPSRSKIAFDFERRFIIFGS
jgi:hypothetical protein